jgi:hypothetical protein
MLVKRLKVVAERMPFSLGRWAALVGIKLVDG